MITNDFLKGKNMPIIQWFPGHMSKARRQVQENLKHVDFVTILVDARLPLSSQNPMLTKIVGEKPKLMILNKADLADQSLTKEWCRYYEEQGIKTLAINSKEQATVKKVTEAAKKINGRKTSKIEGKRHPKTKFTYYDYWHSKRR